MSAVLTFVILTLLVARLSRLVTLDTLWASQRDRLTTHLKDPVKNAETDSDGNITKLEMHGKKWQLVREAFAELIVCVYCNSLWFSGFAVLAMILFTDQPLPYPVLWWPALSMSAIAVIEWTDGVRVIRQVPPHKD